MDPVVPEAIDARPDRPAPTSSKDPAAAAKLDGWLTAGIWAAGIVLVIFGSFFGYSVYAQQQADRLANPAWQVIDAARQALAKNQSDPTLHGRLAEALASGGYLDEAKAELTAAVKLDSSYVGAYVDLATIELQQKEYAASESHWKKVLDITAKAGMENVNQYREAALFNLGQIAYINKDYVGAVGDFNAALRVNKDAADTYLLLAKSYRGMGDPANALTQVDIALKFDPRYPEAHFVRGQIYLSKGDKVDAAWDFRAALDGAPGQPEAQAALDSLGTYAEWYAKATAAWASHEASPAIDAVHVARSIDPGSFDAAMLNGQILMASHDASAAAGAFGDALKIKPNDQTAASALSRAKTASGR